MKTIVQLLAALMLLAASALAAEPTAPTTLYKTTKVNGLDIFYREAGPATAPTILLLPGFPTSSHMFRNLIPALADRYHVIAPDYPGFGQSSMPSDLKDLEFHLLETGHFALEEDGAAIAAHIGAFLAKQKL